MTLVRRWMLVGALVLAAALAFACDGGNSDAPGSTAPATSSTDTATSTVEPSATATAESVVAPTATADAGTTTYVVQAGDTLFSIAQRFGVTVDALAAANGIADPGQISVGQVLTIPRGGVAPPPTRPPPPPPPSGGSAVVVRTVATNEKVVALTFDAGSDTGFAAFILDKLKQNNIKASFGITGRWAEQNPSLVQRVAREGHELINHTYDHQSFTGFSTSTSALTGAQRWDQLDRTEAIIRNLTGESTKPYFRPPYGDYDDSVNADVGARGYGYNVMWTVDSLGWQGLSVAEIRARCLAAVTPGAIYLFHVGAASQDANALQSIIDGLRNRGYRFATIGELLGG